MATLLLCKRQPRDSRVVQKRLCRCIEKDKRVGQSGIAKRGKGKEGGSFSSGKKSYAWVSAQSVAHLCAASSD